MNRLLIASFFLMPLAIAHAANAQQPKYPILIERPYKAGAIFDFHRTLDRTTTLNLTPPDPAEATPPEVHSTKADLAGKLEIKEVFPDGGAKIILLTVKSFKIAGSEEVPAGKVIEITRGEKPSTATLQGGGELSPDAIEILQNAFSPISSGPTNDDIFGSKTPRAAGEKWSVDAAKAAEQFSNGGLKVKPENVSGEVMLKAIEKSSGADAVRLQQTMTLKDARPDNIPADLILSIGEVKATLSGLFPVDLGRQPPEVTMTADIHLKGASGDRKVEFSSHVAVTQFLVEQKK